MVLMAALNANLQQGCKYLGRNDYNDPFNLLQFTFIFRPRHLKQPSGYIQSLTSSSFLILDWNTLRSKDGEESDPKAASSPGYAATTTISL